MKRILVFAGILAVLICASSCNVEELDPTSVIVDNSPAPTDFDIWLDYNYRIPYNIRYIYRYEDIEVDRGHDWAPIKELNARIIARIISYMWLDPYGEVAGDDFMRETSPRVIQVLGSLAYNDNGSVTLGLAEGGLKVTLMGLNDLEGKAEIIYNNGVDETDGYTVIPDISGLSSMLIVMHHEFMHIICGKKPFPAEFALISKDDYAAQWTSISASAAAKMGFVTNYASGAYGEDIAEVYSHYVSMSEEEWQALHDLAGEEGSQKIERKLAIVRQYMKDSWNIDIDRLKDVVARRAAESVWLDWDNYNVE